VSVVVAALVVVVVESGIVWVTVWVVSQEPSLVALSSVLLALELVPSLLAAIQKRVPVLLAAIQKRATALLAVVLVPEQERVQSLAV
jgi:hypothetical protein